MQCPPHAAAAAPCPAPLHLRRAQPAGPRGGAQRCQPGGEGEGGPKGVRIPWGGCDGRRAPTPTPGMVVEEPGAPVPAEGTVAPPQPHGWGGAGGVRGWGSSGECLGPGVLRGCLGPGVLGMRRCQPRSPPSSQEQSSASLALQPGAGQGAVFECMGSPTGILHLGGRNHHPPYETSPCLHPQGGM